MLTVEQVAAIFGVNRDTVRRRIREGFIPAEPLLGNRHAGYLIQASALIKALVEKGYEGQARMVERHVATM